MKATKMKTLSKWKNKKSGKIYVLLDIATDQTDGPTQGKEFAYYKFKFSDKSNVRLLTEFLTKFELVEE